MKSSDFTNEHALFISGDGDARISYDKDTKLANLVKALQRQGKSREEIIKNIQRAKELMAMGRGAAELTPDPYTGTERRKPRQPYYSLAGQSLLAEGVGETCPKCQGKLAHGKDGNKPVKVCVPCRKIFPVDSVKESTPFPVKDAQKVGFPDVVPGDTIRTRKASMMGVVTKVEPYKSYNCDAVYFEVEGPPRRLLMTPLSNVTIVKKAVTSEGEENPFKKYPRAHFPDIKASNMRMLAAKRLKAMQKKKAGSSSHDTESSISGPVGSAANNNY